MSNLPRGIAALIVLVAAAGAQAQVARPEVGRAFAQKDCASCHAIGPTGRSPLVEAPAFRDLQKRYPVDQLAESFAEGVGTGHTAMPEFQIEPARIADFLAYLKTLPRGF